MKNIRLFFLFIPLICITHLNCERDDICIESVIESPDIILLFLDTKDVSVRKSPLNFSIRAIGSDVPVPRSCLLYTSPSPRDLSTSRMPSSA